MCAMVPRMSLMTPHLRQQQQTKGDEHTSLHMAIRHNCEGVAELVAAAMARKKAASMMMIINTKYDDTSDPVSHGMTLLGMAVTHGNFDVAEMLLEAGARPDVRMPSGCSVLSYCASGVIAPTKRRLEFVVALVRQCGVPPDMPDLEPDATVLGCDRAEYEHTIGATPLYHAADAGDVDMVRVLLEAGADINRAAPATGKTPLYAAAARNYFECAWILCTSGRPLNINAPSLPPESETPLLVAARRGHAGMCRLLLSHGATGVETAIRTKSLLAVETLLPLVNYDKSVLALLAFRDALENRLCNVMRALVVAKTKIDIETEIEARLDINGIVPDMPGGATLLYWAADRNMLDSAAMLLDVPGIQPNIGVPGQQRTPLHAAAERGHAKMIKLLVLRGLNVDALTSDGKTPLDLVPDGNRLAHDALVWASSSSRSSWRSGVIPIPQKHK